MKKTVIIPVSLLLIILFSLTGCNAIERVKSSLGKSDKKQVFTSDNGKYEVTATGSWKEDKDLNEEASLQISNRLQERYLIVIDESKEDFSEDLTLQEYADFVKDSMLESGEDMESANNKEITVNGQDAIYFEVSGTVEKIKAKYIVAIAQDKDTIYQVIGWTMSSKFDKSKEELLSVIESLKTKE